MQYQNDEPIKNPLDDKLDHKEFAYNLAKSIKNFKNNENSYVIGICGDWGTGKSSTINMAMSYLKFLIKNPEMKQTEINKKLEEKRKEEEEKKNKQTHKIINVILKLWYSRIKMLKIISPIIFITILYWLVFIILPIPDIGNIFTIPIKLLIKISLFALISLNFFIPWTKLMFKEVNIISYFKKIIKSYQDLWKENEILEIEFNPWQFQNQEKLLQEFFGTISEKLDAEILGKESRKLAKLLIKYTGSITNFNTSPLNEFFAGESNSAN